MSTLLLQACMVAGSAVLFLVVFIANEMVFNSAHFEFVRGVNWIYLPAGMRLLCTLLFGGEGAIGISRDNLSHFIGSATESLTRTLSDFRNEKLIDIRDGKIYLLNKEWLSRLIN